MLCRARWYACFALLAVVSDLSTAVAQIPGAPVLQNAWATAGIVGAVDIAGGSDGTVYAAAASWTPGSGHFELSGGGGFRTRTGGGSGGVYGIRAAVPLFGESSSFGVGAFAGIGGGSAAKPKIIFVDSVASTAEIPVGAAVGWRHAIGGNHGISVYATPSYVFFTGGTKTDGLVRVGVGADVGITKAIGATLGAEFGGNRPRGFGGPSGALYGIGLSYALGHR
ncbi:MAG TPA: hypothetical protein VGM67_10355 [Gemmatimonadaceae bacterium]|jgi:hypothetical protein